MPDGYGNNDAGLVALYHGSRQSDSTKMALREIETILGGLMYHNHINLKRICRTLGWKCVPENYELIRQSAKRLEE